MYGRSIQFSSMLQWCDFDMTKSFPYMCKSIKQQEENLKVLVNTYFYIWVRLECEQSMLRVARSLNKKNVCRLLLPE